jgi:hypothetical protein
MLSDWAHEQEPVFIVGPERSGTSLLFQQVSNHPSFCDFSHATVETFCFVKPWMLLNPAGSENYEMRVYLGSKEQFKAFQNKITPFIERNKMLTGTGLPLPYLGKPERQKIWFERRYKHVLRAFFFHSWNNLGEKRLVEKTPAHIRCVEEILATFPKAKILICTRDLAEIISSHKKRLKKEIELGKQANDLSIAWLAHSTQQYANYLKQIDNMLIDLMGANEQSLVVGYNELTQESTETLSNIYRFLNESDLNITGVTKERPTQAWDTLLNKPPQPNSIDVNAYLNNKELTMLRTFSASLSKFWK